MVLYEIVSLLIFIHKEQKQWPEMAFIKKFLDHKKILFGTDILYTSHKQQHIFMV